jgi:hypothetical protein
LADSVVRLWDRWKDQPQESLHHGLAILGPPAPDRHVESEGDDVD